MHIGRTQPSSLETEGRLLSGLRLSGLQVPLPPKWGGPGVTPQAPGKCKPDGRRERTDSESMPDGGPTPPLDVSKIGRVDPTPICVKASGRPNVQGRKAACPSRQSLSHRFAARARARDATGYLEYSCTQCSAMGWRDGPGSRMAVSSPFSESRRLLRPLPKR